jgi:hypothetical protein
VSPVSSAQWLQSADNLQQSSAAEGMVPSGMRLEFGGGISGNMRLSFQAARSIG